jgi:lipopolysaccharide/colanic/teichoic acid biosynthesis glycosyltransferase
MTFTSTTTTSSEAESTFLVAAAPAVEEPRARGSVDGTGTLVAAGRALDRAAKRSLDLVVSGVLLLGLLPLMLVVAALVKLDSPGPAFYRCQRIGYRGRALRMLKFRKMHDAAAGGPLTTAEDDRFTRLGRVLAKYKLDELPQLWNVFKGDMSIVGPRPEDPHFVRCHPAEFYGEILTVKPGIIGLSQIAFAEENRILDREDSLAHYLERILPQKMALDRMYAARRTMSLDLRVIFWASVAVLLRRPIAVHRSSGAMNLRGR